MQPTNNANGKIPFLYIYQNKAVHFCKYVYAGKWHAATRGLKVETRKSSFIWIMPIGQSRKLEPKRVKVRALPKVTPGRDKVVIEVQDGDSIICDQAREHKGKEWVTSGIEGEKTQLGFRDLCRGREGKRG